MATERMYVKGVEVPGLEFPSVYAYTAKLETDDSEIFDRIFKEFLSDSVLACIDEEGGVLVTQYGIVIRIYLKQKQATAQSSKKSEFFKP